MATDTRTVKIEQWCICSKASEVSEPERSEVHLLGNIFGHPEFVPGARITTSRILNFDGQFVHTKSGLTLSLGDVHPVYGKRYPHARHVLRNIKDGIVTT